jgi:hypothetical protein
LGGRPPRGHLAIASAIIVVGVLISASLFGAEAARSTVTETSVSTITETKTCPNVTGIEGTAPQAPLDVLVYMNATSGIQDLWNATVTGYSGSTKVYSQCYLGINVGEMLMNGVVGGQRLTLVKVTAQKMDSNNDNLTLRVNGLQNSTDRPFGFVSITASPNL